MKERPILFSGAMVRAILEGHKTQTRRVTGLRMGLEAVDRDPSAWHVTGHGVALGRYSVTFEHNIIGRARRTLFCPYGAPGDRLWVRETWAVRRLQAGLWVEYQADGRNARLPQPHEHDIRDEGGKVDLGRYVADRWRPSTHMPRWASRITLEVTGVRAERVQDISEADAQREGCGRPDWPRYYNGETVFNAREAYEHLWNEINASRGYGWNANPWVWVVEFRRAQP